MKYFFKKYFFQKSKNVMEMKNYVQKYSKENWIAILILIWLFGLILRKARKEKDWPLLSKLNLALIKLFFSLNYNTQWARKLKKIPGQKNSWIFFDQIPFFVISKMATNQFLNWEKGLKLSKMQFHEKNYLNYLISRVFLVWLF